MSNNALTIDYEFDWGARVKTYLGIERMLSPLLDVLEKFNSKATFFISTETVPYTKNFIKMICSAGHEIASHGHNHYLYYDVLTKQQLKEQLIKSKDILEELVGLPVKGFRTPYFKKNKYTEELLSDVGYIYDSSSVRTNLYGRYVARQFEYNNLIRFPVSSIYKKFPAGIKWINLFGNRINSCNGINVIYLHLFDLLSITDTFKIYNKIIKKSLLMFYLLRIGSTYKTLFKVANRSNTLQSFLDDLYTHTNCINHIRSRG